MIQAMSALGLTPFHPLPVLYKQLQEVCGLSAFRALLHQHLGGPGAYTMFTQEITTVLAAGGIGPGIALTVFGRTEEVESGVLEMTAGSLKDGQQVRKTR